MSQDDVTSYRMVWLLLPVATVTAVIAFVLLGQPLDDLTASAPPVEELAFEQVRLEPAMIIVTVRADGSDRVRISQVQVDGAYREFTQYPDGALGQLRSAAIRIPYPWVNGEAHHIALVTSTGVTFEHTIEVAQLTPDLAGATLWQLTIVGLLLGVAPVAAGLMFYPALRQAGSTGLLFLLTVTVGLLLFLLIDTLGEGLAVASEAINRLQAEVAVWVAATVTFLVLLLVARRGGRPPEGIQLAFFIALGIGLHNLGEGLAVGASLATGAAALATFLVVGFVIHNVTEGIGIAAPMLRRSPRFLVFIGLASLAGLPAVAGVWAGSQAVTPYLSALALGVGAGAILQVIVEVLQYVRRQHGGGAITSAAGAGGLITGLAVMYATALLV